ncbi:MAG: GTP 3',8-cyclase MoaA [Pirellulaceae bacterium]
MSGEGLLTDPLGRVHNSLRVSVTDRCNIRCFYCMPDEHVRFQPRRALLSFEEIERFVRVVVRLGVNRVRITGGEPLMRAELPLLVRKLAAIPGVSDLAMTTNGMLLAEHAEALRQAGLQRLNISLDTLREETFRTIARRDGLDRVLAGITAAQQAGFARIRLNAVAICGITEPEIIPLAEFARARDLELRFIEFMPLDAEANWQSHQVLSGAKLRACLEQHYGPLVPLTRTDVSQPAVTYAYADGQGRVGFISPVTEPFCGDCNRLRITAEGQLRNCLFSTVEWDARALLRSGASDQQLAELVRTCVGAKKAGHGIDSPEFIRPQRAMYQLGG